MRRSERRFQVCLNALALPFRLLQSSGFIIGVTSRIFYGFAMGGYAMLSRTSSRRTFNDISHDIIRAAGVGERKTRIMYSVGLNFSQLERYLSILMREGFVVYRASERRFRATAKGEEFASVCERYSEARKLAEERERVVEEFSPLKEKDNTTRVVPLLTR